MMWSDFLSTFFETALTALSVVGVMSQYLKFAHRKIGEEAVKWNDLERDLAHLKRNKDAYKVFATQIEDDIQSLQVRVARLESENRILLADKYGNQSV